MKKYKLNNCPFCKSSNVKLHRNFDYVYCEERGARGSYFDGHPEDAVNVWNKVLNRNITFNPSSYKQRRIIADGTQEMKRGE